MRRLTVDKPVNSEPKKPYSPPELVVYGTVRDLTEKVVKGPVSDGGRFPLTHATRVA